MLLKDTYAQVAPSRKDLEKSRGTAQNPALCATPAKLSAKFPDWIPICSTQVTLEWLKSPDYCIFCIWHVAKQSNGRSCSCHSTGGERFGEKCLYHTCMDRHTTRSCSCPHAHQCDNLFLTEVASLLEEDYLWPNEKQRKNFNSNFGFLLHDCSPSEMDSFKKHRAPSITLDRILQTALHSGRTIPSHLHKESFVRYKIPLSFKMGSKIPSTEGKGE